MSLAGAENGAISTQADPSVEWADLVVVRPTQVTPEHTNGHPNFKRFRSKCTASQMGVSTCLLSLDQHALDKHMQEHGHLIRYVRGRTGRIKFET
jgi:hypothetical protein